METALRGPLSAHDDSGEPYLTRNYSPEAFRKERTRDVKDERRNMHLQWDTDISA
jgi:hypothetical protein